MKAVVIGTSTGGPRALETVLGDLPERLNAVVIIIQHLPEQFSEQMANRLDKLCALDVTLLKDKEVLQKGHVYVVPGDHNLYLESVSAGENYVNLLITTQHPHPSVDAAFTSLAEHFSKELLAVVLTGMGEDGLRGARSVKNFDGTVIVQNKETSAVYGMPRAIFDEGLADKVLPLDKIGDEIVEFANG